MEVLDNIYVKRQIANAKVEFSDACTDESECLKWLVAGQLKSIVYVNFGSK